MRLVRRWIISASVILPIYLLAPIPAWGVPANHFVSVSEKMNLTRSEIKLVVEGLGGQLRHCLSETEFIIWLPENNTNARYIFKQLGGAYIEGFHGRISFDTTFSGGTFIRDRPTTEATRIWDKYRSKNLPGGSSASEDALDTTLEVEVLAAPSAESAITQVDRVTSILLPLSSLYMIGEVALSIVMMESTGSLYNWTTQDEDDAIVATIIETDSISSEALNDGIQVTWVYEMHRGVPTSYEPIEHSDPTDGFTWINDALAFFNSGSGWGGTFALAQTVANSNNANWGTILFLVMNLPGGNNFPNGERAYAPLKGSKGEVDQGTFAISTFTGILWEGTGQHELSHLFGALDEGGGTAGCEEPGIDCSNTFGYLAFPNTNCQFCDLTFFNCIMLFSDRRYCPWSKGHIGWKDSDGDGAPDPIDPNSDRWMSILPVLPGDRVIITLLTGALVAAFNVTENNSYYDDGLGIGFTIWDGQNFDNVTAAAGNYYVKINNNPAVLLSLHDGDPSTKPSFSDAGFWFDDSLRFKLGTTFANVTIVLKDSTGQVVGRPLWDKLFSSFQSPVQSVDLSFLPDKIHGGVYRLAP